MVQNHLLQILCLIAMEPPVSFDADEVRNKKVDVLRAIRPILPEDVHHVAVRGQYGTGLADGKPVPGYREEPDVAPDSPTETFAAFKLFIDNWRWQGVPFYLRTGKRLHDKVSEVSILFRSAPHQPFPSAAVENWQPNRLMIRIQPEEGIVTRIQAKQPGTRILLGPVDMQFRYREAFRTSPPEAYETLLLDVIRGDATLFMRADQVECAWTIVTPVLEAWESVPPADFPDYPAGKLGAGGRRPPDRPGGPQLAATHDQKGRSGGGRSSMIRIYRDLEALSHAAAELFTAEARQAVQTRGRFMVALAGGSTPRRTYELLAREPFRDAGSLAADAYFLGGRTVRPCRRSTE